MTLQRHMIRVVVLSVGIMLLGALIGLKTLLYFGLESNNAVMMAGFQKIENGLADRELRRAQNAYQSEILRLEESSVDWAQWDEMWLYAKNRSKEFENSNFSFEVFSKKGISHFAVFDSQNNLIGGVCTIGCNSPEQVFPPDVAALFPKNSPFFHFDKGYSQVYSGLIAGENGPLLFASRPITPSSGIGEIRGTVLFTRILDSVRIDALSDLTNLNLSIQSLQYNSAIVKWPHYHVANDSQMFGELLMRDVSNIPRYRMIVKMDRPVYQNALLAGKRISQTGNWTQFILTLCTFLSAVFLISILGYVLNQLIIRRIRTLSESTAMVREKGDLAYRIPSLGEDEIGNLGSQFNDMLAYLEQSRLLIQTQSIERKALLDALPTGILALDSSFCISGIPSAAALEMLGRNCIEKPWCTALNLLPDQETFLLDFLDVFSQELLPVTDMTALNPFPEICLQQDPERWVKVSYYRLPHGSHPQLNEPVMLAVLEDISQIRTTSNELKVCLLENNWLRAVLADPDLFLEFFRESEQGLSQIEANLKGKLERAFIARAFRHAHTLQGCALGFGLFQLSDAAIVLEHQLTRLLQEFDSGVTIDPSDVEKRTHLAVTSVRTILASEQMRLHKVLSQQVMDWKSGPSLRLPLHKLREWSALLASGERDIVRRSIDDCFQLPMKQILHRTLLWFPGLISRSENKATLTLVGEEIRIPMDWSGILNDILVHLLRNCLAHGIESPEERLLLGKPELGMIRILARQDGSKLEICVEDDGRGFQVDLQQAFALGFSSKTIQDTLAGRGVGLHAVKSMIEELGGNISVSTVPHQGARMVITFDTAPKVIL